MILQLTIISVFALACGAAEAMIIHQQSKLINDFDKQIKKTIQICNNALIDYHKELMKNMKIGMIIAKADMEKENYGITMKKIKEELQG